MFSPNANWNAATAAYAKAPVQIIRFEGYDSVQFATGPVKSASRTTKLLLKGPDSLSQMVDPLDGRFDVGSIHFILTDSLGTITDLISTEKSSPTLVTLLNRRVRWLSGYADLVESDYAEIYRGFVTELQSTAAGYEFAAGDPKRPTVQELFLNAEAAATKHTKTFDQAASAGDRKIHLSGTGGINIGDKLFVRNGDMLEERVQVRQVAGDRITLEDALRYDYADGDSVRWAATEISGHPLDIFYCLLTGLFKLDTDAAVSTTLDAGAASGQKVIPLAATTGIELGRSYRIRNAAGTVEEAVWIDEIDPGVSVTARDNLMNTYASSDTFASGAASLTAFSGMPTGLGIATADIDDAAIASERDNWMPGMGMSFEAKNRRTGMEFLQKELRLFGYPIITGAGKISFKVSAPRLPNVSILTLGESDIVDWSWERRYDAAYNKLVIRYDYDAERDIFVSEATFEDTTDQSTTGVRELVIESRGLISGLISDIQVEQYAKRFLMRYVKGAPMLKVKTHATKRVAELGDVIDLTHSKIPDIRSGARGITTVAGSAPYAGFEVIDIKQTFSGDVGIMLTLMDNAWTRPGFIAPTGQPDYGGASASQKKYAYISGTGGTNFADGTPTYRII